MHMQTEPIQDIKTERKRKSEELTSEELRKLKKYVSGFSTKGDCSSVLGFNSRNTLTNILKGGTGAPESIARIREVIGVQTS